MRRTTPLARLVLFAIMAAASITTLPAAAAVARPWLGVVTQEVTSDLREGLDLHGDGVLVNRVIDESPAARAGLRKGDLIVRYNARSVESPEALAHMVGEAHNGQAIALEILRHGERQTLTVTLDPRPSGDSDDEGMASAPPTPPAAPDAPEAPQAPRDGEDDHAGRSHREMRVRVVTPDGEHGEHGSRHVYRFDGDMNRLPPDVHRMLGEMHMQGMGGNGDGMRRIVLNAGSRLRLGVRIESLSEDLASALDAPSAGGVLVVQVIPDTPAARSGLKAGDVILSVNNLGVKNAEELQKALREADGKVSLSVSRKGSRRTVETELRSSLRGGDTDEDSPGPGRMEGFESGGHTHVHSDSNSDDLRKQMDELRQQMRELRQQLEGQRDHH